jgi:nucleoside-diphosphate-sugar epimerase
MKVDLRFRVLKDKSIEQMEYMTPGPLDNAVNVPNKGWYVTTGINNNLMKATKLAIKRMITYLGKTYGLTKHQAMVLCSVAVDLKIHEVVDTPNWNVGAALPLSIFHEKKKRVCVIGGTGCAGTPTVQAFLDGGFEVTVLSRGGRGDGHYGRPANEGQNAAKQKRLSALKEEGVQFIACDRMLEREKFRSILAESNFHVIVDYWAMLPVHVQDVIDGTKGTSLQSYVFVSTNMVYKGGPEAFDVRNGTDGPWLKEYDVDVVEYSKYAPDTYGGRKVYCEALLKKAYEKHGFPYTALRMPSVIGPQADWRWSKLQQFVAEGNPIAPHGGVGNKFRIVFSEDIGKACYLIAANSAKTAGEAINFCQDETPTYSEFLECLADCLGLTPPEAKEGDKTITEVSPFSNYEGQWILDTKKAKDLLGWKTTPMKEWMQKTVDWHKENVYFTGGDLPVADKAIR